MMRDPYLYDDADVMKNLAGIKDADLLYKAEADITNLAITGFYNRKLQRYDTATLHEDTAAEQADCDNHSKYEQIGEYKVKAYNYKERPHEYVDAKK